MERVRFAPDAAPPAPDPAARFDDAGASHVGPAAAGASVGDTAGTTSRDRESPSRDYSPASTLYPRYWFPVIREPVATAKTTVGDVEVPRTELLGYALGGRTSGIDLVGRHAYEAGAQVFTAGGRGEGDVSYEYRGLGNPTIGVTASQTWDDDGVRVRRPEAGAAGSPAAFFVLERERRLATSVRVRRPGVRLSTSLRLSAGLVRSDREVLDDALRPTDGFRLVRASSLLSEYAVSFSVSSARSHAFQMGNARGAALYLRARTRDDLDVPGGLAGRDAVDLSVDDLIGRVRAYIPLPGPGFAAPVLAVRASGGTARGPGAQTGYFGVGGASGDRVSLPGAPTLVGGSVFLPVRGYETSAQSGPHRMVHQRGAARAARARQSRDAGRCRCTSTASSARCSSTAATRGGRVSSSGDESPRPSVLLSAGFEVSTDLLALYGVPLRLRAGAAFPFIERKGPALLRSGRSAVLTTTGEPVSGSGGTRIRIVSGQVALYDRRGPPSLGASLRDSGGSS